MNTATTYVHYFNSSADTLDVVLHGGSKGVDSPLMVKVFQALREAGHSVISFNFPYLERNEENSSGPDLKEELDTLSNFLDLAKADKYKHIRFVAKSLGGIVASYFLKSVKGNPDKYSVVILGYVKGDGGMDLKDFLGKISIIQGSKDKFGNIEAIKDDLKDALSSDINYYEIEGADHSYREPDTKEPIYEDKAIEVLKKIN